jgi:hypothetical protein
MMRAQTEILFFRWVTLTERKRVTFRERRSGLKGADFDLLLDQQGNETGTKAFQFFIDTICFHSRRSYQVQPLAVSRET